MKKIASGELTKTLMQIQTELSRMLEDLENILHELEGGKQAAIDGVINVVSPDISPDKREFIEGQVEENITKSLQEIAQARTWIGRLNNVARNGIDIAKKVEQTWFDALKNYIQESRWYREHFPQEYEARQREREYERYRLRPETFYGKPSADEMNRMREFYKTRPEELFRDVSELREMKSSLSVRAQVKQLDTLTADVERITKSLLELITTYFSADSPVLAASNKIVSKLKSDRARKINPTLIEALGDEVQALEALFGFGEYPGRFITSGARAFLIPAMKSLQVATQILNNPIREVGEMTTTKEQLQQMVSPKPEQPITESPEIKARRKILLEKLNIVANRKKRCRIIQRIASSREKEDFSNG